MGVSATSSENYAAAIGNGATASGQYSFAFGQSTASADNAVAMGDTATKAQVPGQSFFKLVICTIIFMYVYATITGHSIIGIWSRFDHSSD